MLTSLIYRYGLTSVKQLNNYIKSNRKIQVMIDKTLFSGHTKLEGVRRKKSPVAATTPEGKVKKQVREILDNTPSTWYFMPVQNGMGQSGIPDFICCVKGKFLGIETKSKYSSRKLTALQAKQITLIENSGGTAIVINEDNIDTLPNILEQL